MAPEGPLDSRRQIFGVFTVDMQFVVRTWDPFVAAITGIAVEQALNRPIASVLPHIEANGLLATMQQVASSGMVEVLSPALHRDLIAGPTSGGSAAAARGQQRVTIGPLREDVRITGVAVTVEDVTVRAERDTHLTAQLTQDLGAAEWPARQSAVRGLSAQGPAIVDALVKTLREQHRNFNVLSSLLDLLSTTEIDVVGPLIECLSDEDVDLRIQTALILGHRRDRRAVPALIKALNDPDVNVRFHAMEALGSLRAVEAIDTIVEITAGSDFFLAFPAIQTLAKLGAVNAAPKLVPLLNDELLRVAVAEALGQLGDELVVVPLVKLLNDPSAPTEVVADALSGLFERYDQRYGAGDHIASLVRGTIDPTGTQNLLDAVQRVGPDRLRGIARVMGWLNGPAVQRALVRLLGQQAVRAQVVEAMVRYGAGVVELLIDQLRAEDLDTRQAAAVALGRIGDRTATPALVAALRDPELAVAVASALARIGDYDAFDDLLGLLDHPDTAVRQAAIGALNSIGHPDMAARILPLLDDPNPIVRESAVKIAGYFGYRECVDRVIDRCADAAEAVRRAAVEHLPFFDPPKTIPALLHALEHDTAPVRAAAATALARVSESDALAPLVRALDDRDPWVRFCALRSIGAFANRAVAPAVLDVIERDRAGHVRLAAIDALGRLDTPDALTILHPLTLSAEPDVARAAIRALGQTSDAQADDLLERLLRSADAWRRVEAATAMGARGKAAAASSLQWLAAADGDRDVVDAAVGALALMGSREGPDGVAAITALIALTAEPRTRETLVASLAGLPQRRIDDVARGLRHPSPDVRRATIEALSRMKHPRASQSLETALDDSVAAVRATAVAELRRLGSRNAAKKLLALARTDPDLEVRQAAVMAVTQYGGELVDADRLVP
jgi:HEAT repeat protein